MEIEIEIRTLVALDRNCPLLKNPRVEHCAENGAQQRSSLLRKEAKSVHGDEDRGSGLAEGVGSAEGVGGGGGGGDSSTGGASGADFGGYDDVGGAGDLPGETDGCTCRDRGG